MQFPPKKQPSGLNGRYRVTVTGLLSPWKVLNRLGDIKQIISRPDPTTNKQEGYNLIPGHGDWGWFYIEPLGGGDGRYALNYDHPENPKPLRMVQDIIRPDPKNEGAWLGTLFFEATKVFTFRLDPIY